MGLRSDQSLHLVAHVVLKIVMRLNSSDAKAENHKPVAEESFVNIVYSGSGHV